LDDGDSSGPFASALAAELRKPAQIDLLLFHHVRVAVDRATHGVQVPWIEDGILRQERVYLGGPGPSLPPTRSALAWVTLPPTNYLVNERSYTIYATNEPDGRDSVVDSIQHGARRPLNGAGAGAIKAGKLDGIAKWYMYKDIKGRDAYVAADEVTLK